METPKFEIPIHEFQIPFNPRNLHFSPIIEREKFRKNIDIKFIKSLQPYLDEYIDRHTLFFLKGTGNNSRIEFQSNKISFIKNLNAGVSEWEYRTDNNTTSLHKFNESSGATSFKDERGIYPFSVSGAPTAGVLGKTKSGKSSIKKRRGKTISSSKLENAVSLDGTDDYLLNATLLNSCTSEGTIEMWFTPLADWGTSRKTFFYRLYDAAPAQEICLEYNVNLGVAGWEQALTFYFYISGFQTCLTTQTTWTPGTWYHIGCLWGTANTWGSTGMKNVVNGVCDGTNAYTLYPTNTSSGNIALGFHLSDSSHYANMKVDLFRVSNIQRTKFGGNKPSVIL